MNRFFILIFIITMAETVSAGYNREACYTKVKGLLKDGLLTRNDTAFFHDRSGMPMSSPDNPVLTLQSCNSICGKDQGWYVDIGPRLSNWLIPVFLLLSNMEVSPLDKRRYLMLVHLLGDPIDSLWSLLMKMEAWSRCYYMAIKVYGPGQPRKVRNLATLLGGIEELVGFDADPMEVYRNITSQPEPEHLNVLIARTAQHLADSRTDERLRTILATALYFYQLLSAFVTVIGGGNTSPPGGRIGIAMFMTWIIPSILLSNAIGGFTSVRTCFRILEEFSQAVNPDSDLWLQLKESVPALEVYNVPEQYFESLSWSGGIYTYRPDKHISFLASSKSRSSYLFLVLAVAPILTSSIIASVILWNTPPIGINCRNFLIFSLTIFIFLSAAFTSLTYWRGVRGKLHWYITLVKDALVAIPFVILIFLATSGAFNTCWCWSGVYSLGKAARIPLNPKPQFQFYNKTIYPILVGVCLILQLSAFVAMMRVTWAGWNIMRWSERERQEEWARSRRALQRHLR
jgi:hypothetical protein